MKRYNKYFIAKWYYYATPLFILLDYFLGINVRVSALDAMPFYKYAYYGFCILCGLCMYIFPRYSPVVALFESTINVIMMALLLFIPYVLLFSDAENMLSTDSPIAQMFTPQRIVNLGFAGFVAVYAFRASVDKLTADFTSAKQPQIQPPSSDSNQRPSNSASR